MPDKNSDVQRKLREKNAEAQAKKQPAPAKPKPAEKPAKKVAARKQSKKVDSKKKHAKKESAKQPEFITGGNLTELKAAAAEVLPKIREGCKRLGEAYADSLQTRKYLHDALDRELWRYDARPYKNETAFIKDMVVVCGKSAATLFDIVGAHKLLPSASPEDLHKAPRRVTQKIKKAARVAREKGKPTPDDLVSKAASGTPEEEIISEIEARELSEAAKPKADDRHAVIPECEPLMAKTNEQTFPFDPKKGGSGVFEGQSGQAQQYSSKIARAIEIAKVLYLDPNVQPPMTDSEWFDWICEVGFGEAGVDVAQVLRNDVDREKLLNMSNREAAEFIAEEKSQQKKAKHSHA
jgi:hypothetical protein